MLNKVSICLSSPPKKNNNNKAKSIKPQIQVECNSYHSYYYYFPFLVRPTQSFFPQLMVISVYSKLKIRHIQRHKIFKNKIKDSIRDIQKSRGPAEKQKTKNNKRVKDTKSPN